MTKPRVDRIPLHSLLEPMFWGCNLGIVFKLGSPDPVGHVGVTHVPSPPKGRAGK